MSAPPTVNWQQVETYLRERKEADDYSSRTELAAALGIHYSTYNFRKLCNAVGIRKATEGSAHGGSHRAPGTRLVDSICPKCGKRHKGETRHEFCGDHIFLRYDDRDPRVLYF